MLTVYCFIINVTCYINSFFYHASMLTITTTKLLNITCHLITTSMIYTTEFRVDIDRIENMMSSNEIVSIKARCHGRANPYPCCATHALGDPQERATSLQIGPCRRTSVRWPWTPRSHMLCCIFSMLLQA